MAKLTKAQIVDIEAAKQEMRAWLKPGTTLYTQLDHVSRSGMMRHISVKIVEEGEIRDITWHVANVLNEKRTKEGSIKVGGCGMDMGFSLIYNLSSALYPKGYECIGEEPIRCPSNDHFNGDRDYTPHHHGSGGYALKQRWL
jgi:hypothetical protein